VLLGVNGIVHLDSFTSYNIAAAIGVALALLLRFTIGLAAGALGLLVSVGVILLHGSSFVPRGSSTASFRCPAGRLGPVGAAPVRGPRW